MLILNELSLNTLLLSAAILFLAGLVHGTLGLGFPLIATPLLALFMDVRSAILVTLLPTVTVNVASILRGGHWGESIGQFWPMGVYSLIGGAIGASFIIVSDPAPFKLLLALLIFLYLGSGWLGQFKMNWVVQYKGWSMLVFGLVAGIAAGSTNVMVPILIIYTLEMGLSATAMVQVFNMCFLSGKVAQIVMFAAAGMIGAGFLLSTAPLAVVALAALLLGMSVRNRISSDNYRNIVKGVLLVLALILTAQYFTAI